MRRVFTLVFGIASVAPASAEQPKDIFASGNVLCSNYDALTETCRTITTITKRDGDIRFSTSIRKVALPNEQVVMETEGASRVDALKSCGLYPTARPRITPFNSKYIDALIMVHERKRDYRLARGVCVEYRPCGTAYRVYRTHSARPEPKLLSLTTVFEAGNPHIAKLKLRNRVYGVPETPPSDCEPLG